MSPAEIRRALAAVEASIARHRAAMEADERQAMLLRQMLELHDASLLSGNSSSTVARSMETEHRLAISKGRASKRDPKFAAACQAAGYSTTTLAEALGFDKSTLSRYRSGLREVPADVRQRVQALIGWSASRWPKLG